MTIQGIQNYNLHETRYSLAKKKAAMGKPLAGSGKRIEDTYEPVITEDRKKYLDEVKKKIKEGYYNSKEVVEDLSESFAKVFDKSL